jgi:hypothetical protein
MAKPTCILFAPTGQPITSIVTRGWQNQHILVIYDPVLDQWSADGNGADDHPKMDPWLTRGGHQIVADIDSCEFLVEHCRRVEIYPGFDYAWLSEEDLAQHTLPEAWPESIVDDCTRLCELLDLGAYVDDMRSRLPKDWKADGNLEAVIDCFIDARLRGEVTTLRQRIADFREGRVEVTAIVPPAEPADEVEDALALMRGGV